MMEKRFYIVLLVAVVGAVLAGRSCIAAPPSDRFEYSQLHLGVQVRIVLYAPDEEAAKIAARAAFERIADLENVFSSYRPDSELRRLSAEAVGRPVPVSRDLFTVLQAAQDLGRRTGGAFDVTVGPYVALWRRARETEQLPTAVSRSRASARVGWEKIRLGSEKRTVRLSVPGMRLDLGGIAKGYILDRALEVLFEEGVQSALIEAGGDIVTSSAPPGRDGWRVTIANAAPGERTVSIAHRAIATSGDTEQFVEIDGTRYSHVVDPHTGIGLTSRVAATVIAPDGMTADSYATALTVLGPQCGQALARRRPGVSAYIRYVTEEGVIHRRVEDSSSR